VVELDRPEELHDPVVKLRSGGFRKILPGLFSNTLTGQLTRAAAFPVTEDFLPPYDRASAGVPPSSFRVAVYSCSSCGEPTRGSQFRGILATGIQLPAVCRLATQKWNCPSLIYWFLVVGEDILLGGGLCRGIDRFLDSEETQWLSN